MMHSEFYSGFISVHDHGDSSDVLFVGNEDTPLAETIQVHIGNYGNYLTVRYWISNKKRSIEGIKELALKTILGLSEAEFSAVYSEITGYLWTDETIKVGGHDLLHELWANEGKFLYMEIGYSHDPRPS